MKWVSWSLSEALYGQHGGYQVKRWLGRKKKGNGGGCFGWLGTVPGLEPPLRSAKEHPARSDTLPTRGAQGEARRVTID